MTKAEVQKIAQLARLQLSDKEIDQYAKQLSQILEYINQLKEVDTKEVIITSQVTGLTNVFREDVVEECGVRDELLAQAPAVEEGGIKVKKVL